MSQPNRLDHTIRNVGRHNAGARLNTAFRHWTERIAARNEKITREALRRSLRPRLRWITVRPNADRYIPTLIRAGLLTPPTLWKDEFGRVIHVTRKLGA